VSLWHLFLAFSIIVIGGLVAHIATSAYRHRRRYRDAVALFRGTPDDRRLESLEPLLRDQDVNAAAWYLRGACCLRRGRTREAARAFGIAHHADWRLQTASLLTFAALKAAEGDRGDILEQIVTTWREMKEPTIPEYDEDRTMLDCLAATTAMGPSLTGLGRLAWGVISPAQQERLKQLLIDRAEWAMPLVGDP
jgi:hypothetical protein